MKKRILALVLALTLTLTGTTLAANNSTDNFTCTKVYSGQFTDLTTASAHYENVKALYEYGLSVGKADGRYGMGESMLVGEVVIFAGRIRSLYRTGDAEAGAAAHAGDGTQSGAYGPYLSYLQAEHVLDKELDGVCGETATRAQVAHVLANTLPASALPAVNAETVTQGYALGLYITDVTDYTPYQNDILRLYQCGLSQGSDSRGSFRPDAAITRAEAAAILTRMVDPDLRLSLSWDLSGFESAAGTTLGDLVPAGTLIQAPANEEELDSSIRYMLSRNEHVLNLKYSGLTSVKAGTVMNQALSIVKDYCEQMYNAVSCTYSTQSGALRLEFSAANVSAAQLSSYREDAMERAIQVHDSLWKAGTLHAGMTEKEIARVYFTWICQNTAYDYSADKNSLSHIAYTLFHDGKAVCDGYTGAYNLLLKLEGIDCWTQSNSDHIWTVAELDGTLYHIDTTWGDSSAAIQYQYFAMTPEQAWTAHRW